MREGASSRRQITSSLAAARTDDLPSRSASTQSRSELLCVQDAKDAFSDVAWEPTLKEPWAFTQELRMTPTANGGTDMKVRVAATSALDIECRDIAVRELLQLIPEILSSLPSDEVVDDAGALASSPSADQDTETADRSTTISVYVQIPLCRLQLHAIGRGDTAGVPLVTVDLAGLSA